MPRSSRQPDHTKSPDHRKETQTAVAWTYLPFIRSGQNHLESKGEEDKAGKRGGKTTLGNEKGMEFAKSQGAVENREKWRKLVVKSSVVHQ